MNKKQIEFKDELHRQLQINYEINCTSNCLEANEDYIKGLSAGFNFAYDKLAIVSKQIYLGSDYYIEFKRNKKYNFFSYEFVFATKKDWRIRVGKLIIEANEMPF